MVYEQRPRLTDLLKDNFVNVPDHAMDAFPTIEAQKVTFVFQVCTLVSSTHIVTHDRFSVHGLPILQTSSERDAYEGQANATAK